MADRVADCVGGSDLIKDCGVCCEEEEEIYTIAVLNVSCKYNKTRDKRPKVILAYYYFFYVFYKMMQASASRRGAPTKAAAVMGWLEIMTVICLWSYFMAITKLNLVPELPLNPYTISLVGIVVYLKYYYLFRKDDWKKYVRLFNCFPSEKRGRYNWIVFFLVILLIVNFASSYLLLSNTDFSL